MKRLIFALALFSSPAMADGFSTVDEYQADFESARSCVSIDGRKVWKGKTAFYIQSWLFRSGSSGLLDDSVAAAVPVNGNPQGNLAVFVDACD
tara:strand:+ start:7496 stop:7774 length:279 start_codon:yes stop_codon:yes gene_type:complete